MCKCGFPRWGSGKESASQCRRCRSRGFDPWVSKITWRREWLPTPVYLPDSLLSGLPCSPPADLPNLGIEPMSSALQAESLPSEPPGNPKNTGVGSLSLLQGNFPTQESNWGLLHCRRILYQLRYSSNRLVTQLTQCKVLYILKIYICKQITNNY